MKGGWKQGVRRNGKKGDRKYRRGNEYIENGK